MQQSPKYLTQAKMISGTQIIFIRYQAKSKSSGLIVGNKNRRKDAGGSGGGGGEGENPL